MGLLDDAIREHLELKRQHGADPDEVAQQEHAALAPPDAAGPPATEPPADDDEGAIAHGAASPGAKGRAEPDSSEAIQETAEIDMRTVLASADVDGEEPSEMPHREPREAHARPAAARIDPRSSTPGVEADPLGWEVPATRSRLFKRRSVPGRTSSGDLPTEGSLP